jgi:hypothetical protein
LYKTGSFLGALGRPSLQKAGISQDPVYRTWRNCDNIFIKHHEGQSSIALMGVVLMVINDLFLLPFLKPEITGNQTIVLIYLAIALLPASVFAGRQVDPIKKSTCWYFCFLDPVCDEINNRISGIMWNPHSF